VPVEFISSTHFGSPEARGYAGLDPVYALRYIRMRDDGGFDGTLCGYDSTRIDLVSRRVLSVSGARS
jgi:hypothetical protein